MADNGRFDEVRQEIMQLLRTQLEALADLSGLTDAQLTACYERQERVRELRNRLSLEEKWTPGDATLPSPASNSLSGKPEAAVAGL
jgi:hypothetical protein